MTTIYMFLEEENGERKAINIHLQWLTTTDTEQTETEKRLKHQIIALQLLSKVLKGQMWIWNDAQNAQRVRLCSFPDFLFIDCNALSEMVAGVSVLLDTVQTRNFSFWKLVELLEQRFYVPFYYSSCCSHCCP